MIEMWIAGRLMYVGLQKIHRGTKVGVGYCADI